MFVECPGRKPSAYKSTTEDNMRAALVLGVVAALALSVAASAQEAVYPRHGYAPYGYRYAYGYHHRHYGYHHRYARYRY